MKQHISSSQLKELSFEQVRYLGERTNVISYPRTQDEWEESKEKEYLTMYITLLERLNIGFLIEILKSRKPTGIGKALDYMIFDGKEMCDVLWDEVKSVL
jgi:hypothetical protein